MSFLSKVNPLLTFCGVWGLRCHEHTRVLGFKVQGPGYRVAGYWVCASTPFSAPPLPCRLCQVQASWRLTATRSISLLPCLTLAVVFEATNTFDQVWAWTSDRVRAYTFDLVHTHDQRV